MKFSIPSTLLLLQSLVLGSPIGPNHGPPPPPTQHSSGLTFEPLCTINLTTVAPIPLGVSKTDTLLMIPVIGGSFSGPKLKGKILPVGFDLASTSANGTFTPRGKFILQTDDGTNIYFEDTGFAPRIHATFLAGDGPYAWLNEIIAVGKVEQLPTGALLTLYQV